jgi:hypothetical protein
VTASDGPRPALPGPDTLVEREPGFLDALVEARRLLRRALAQPKRVLAVTLLLTLAVVGRRALKAPTYPGEVVLRVTESLDAPGVGPKPVGRLREHVVDAVFTAPRLLPILHAHQINASWLAKDENFAVQSFKEDIEVITFRNYFLEDRYHGDPARSARISIAYFNHDPVLALTVARELAELVVEQESLGLTEQVEVALAAAAIDARHAREDVERRVAELAEARASGAVGARRLEEELEAAKVRLGSTQRFQASLELSLASERQRLGVRFDVVDAGVAVRPRPLWVTLVALGFAVFLGALPVVAIGFGAFDRRVRLPEDIERLGMRLVGHVRVRGFGAGSLSHRRDASDVVE